MTRFRYGDRSLITTSSHRINVSRREVYRPRLHSKILSLLMLFVPQLRLFPKVMYNQLRCKRQRRLRFDDHFRMDPPGSSSRTRSPKRQRRGKTRRGTQLRLVSVFLQVFDRLMPFQIFPIRKYRSLVFHVIGHVCASAPNIRRQGRASGLARPRPLPSSHVSGPDGGSSYEASTTIFLRLQRKAPFRDFCEPQSWGACTTYGVPPNARRGEAISSRYSLSTQRYIRGPSDTIPSARPATMANDSPFPTSPIPSDGP